MVPAIFGCVFGVLGILTIGIVFVPLAALCSFIGVISGIGNLRPTAVFVAIIGIVLTIIGWVMSPSMWILTGLVIASDLPPNNQRQNTTDWSQQAETEIRQSHSDENPEVCQKMGVSCNGATLAPDSQPNSATPTQPRVVSPLPAPSTPSQAYTDGRNARTAYEHWFSVLAPDDYRAGAEYWAGHRSAKPAPTTCRLTSPAFEQGCLEAKRQLTPSDVRRKGEADFKLGWNSL
jgi:hypothetical protein